VAVARRADPDYDFPITREWLQEVKEALKERGAQARLARDVGCSPSTLNELLKEGKTSHLVPYISKALGISTTAMIVSRDTQEIVVFLEKMGDAGRKTMRDLKSLDRTQLDLILSMIAQLPKTKDD
jgi:hypothetical protein